MSRYVKLEDIQAFPIRIDHCDHKNGNIHFILGIETALEYIDYLPQYELPDAEQIDRPEFAYKDEEKYEYHLSCPFCKHDWWNAKPFPPFCPKCHKEIVNKIQMIKGMKAQKEDPVGKLVGKLHRYD